jgi:tRNA-2-methylthio-N6-dimethylallyladenosine synthase
MVESYNAARGQVVGRSSQNKTVNFTAAGTPPPIGGYVPVRITQTLPNCLVGEVLAAGPGVPDEMFFVPAERKSQFVVLN